MVEDIEV